MEALKGPKEDGLCIQSPLLSTRLSPPLPRAIFLSTKIGQFRLSVLPSEGVPAKKTAWRQLDRKKLFYAIFREKINKVLYSAPLSSGRRRRPIKRSTERPPKESRFIE